MKLPAALSRLPPASEAVFPGLFAWSPISTSALTAALNLDRGLWATWRNRRLTPAAMPPAWFRRAPGGPLVYRVSDVLVWLAARRGEQLTTLDAWRHSLLTKLDTDVSDQEEVRKLVVMYARACGTIVGDVTFTPAGFQANLTALLSS